MAIIGYECSDHGFRHDCTVGDSGERQCTHDNCTNYVTSITGCIRGSGKSFKVTFITEKNKTRSRIVYGPTAESAYTQFMQSHSRIQTVKRMARVNT